MQVWKLLVVVIVLEDFSSPDWAALPAQSSSAQAESWRIIISMGVVKPVSVVSIMSLSGGCVVLVADISNSLGRRNHVDRTRDPPQIHC